MFPSVIICARDQLEEITIPCLESVVRNTFIPHELILVDDGSHDRTIEYFSSLTPLALRNERSRGNSYSRNIAMTAASGDPLVFLDNDTLVPRFWLSILIRESQKEGIGIVAGIPTTDITRLNYMPSADMLLDFQHVGAGCTALTRRCFNAVGFFDLRLGNNGQDTDYCYRAIDAGFRVASTPDLIYYHRGGGTRSRLGFMDKLKMRRAARYFKMKHPGKPGPRERPYL